ncbi:MAG: glycosyltransferase family 9 protein [Candidatus Gastranaerophilales bacterium]|nr:glycosyltransferase family 9 protein [Candidatus Gastranaerophilales bacterium]
MLKDKKILLIRLSALGDVVFNIPLANLLKKNGAKLYWLTSEKGYDIVKNNPCCDEVILAPVEKWKKEKNKLKNLIEYFKIITQLRKEKFDIALDTQLILKSFVWTKFCGAKRRIVAKNAREGAIYGGNEKIEAMFQDFTTHAVQNYFKFAKYLNLNTDEIIMTLPKASDEVVDKIDNLLGGLDKNKLNLVVAPATTWDNKHWNKDKFREFISKVNENKYNIIFAGTNKDVDLIEYISQKKGLNLAGKTNLKELIELFSRADILVSLDSGSTHLGWATNKPKIISIYCATPAKRYAPIGEGHIALEGSLACKPCHKKKCPLGTMECTNYPSVDEVINALNKITSKLIS